MAKSIKINDVEYQFDDLSATAKQLLSNIQIAESKLKQLNAETSLVQTARNTYAQALVANLPKKDD